MEVGVGVHDSFLLGKRDDAVVLIRMVSGARAVDGGNVRELVDHGDALVSAAAAADRGRNLIICRAGDNLVAESVGEDTVATIALFQAITAVVGDVTATEAASLIGDGLVAGGDLLAGCGVGSAEVLFEPAGIAVDSGIRGGSGKSCSALKGGLDYGLLASSAGFELEVSAAALGGGSMGIDRGQQRSCGEKGESELHCKERLWYREKND